SMIIGAITSALIYVLWYILIKELAGVTSAVIQMLVPLIVVLSSAPLLGEKITIRILLAGSAMIFGILLVTLPQENKKGFSNKSGR
ncbi:EamA family transporter, partial [Acidithiobacillus caldus]|uniref:EamA family transporter n=2 Tax=Acidithiobacillaceae TaxID=225058 RepID=UPI001C06854D